ncbi:GNAT family N-acetyltransferase [Galbitalea sp. SE-J8]|uniref:GNAT family N-acetyltransferase n=1 Tax=Galbitalea sp. SE-J8 TaxID=3054952 RepID=UPI00259CD30E|nr:GNAT family N-acetyltransferase [Galbitalea sp. SE-J8]MDM4762923.1 GNAT family N-acetyltransferase [Galbitalea sp. SE-J8]
MTPHHVIERVRIPASVTDADAADYLDAIEVLNAAEAADLGTRDTALDPAPNLAWFHRDWEPRELYAIRVDGRFAAALERSWEADSPATETMWPAVRPEFRRRGLGSALAEHGIALATDAGRTAVQTWTSAPAPGPAADGRYARALESPTGFGSIDADHPSVRFAVRHGFALGQIERISRLPLPVDALGDALGDAPADDGYDIVHWVGATPPEHRAGKAALLMAIQRDAPAGELDAGFTAWDPDRVAEVDAANLAASDAQRPTVLAVHRATGAAAGFSAMLVPRALERPAWQGETIVDPAHRGHGLGMRLKRANLAFLREIAPGHPSVITYNAEENRFMLDVNEKVGFVPIGYEGGWRREL